MRLLVLAAISFLIAGCSSDTDRFNRGYVISQSQVDAEQEAPQPEESDSH